METLVGLSSGDSATLETPSRDGKFLLQLLKGGNNRQKVGDKDHVQGQEEECPSWQVHDPAVAAMGPSHPFPIIVGDNNSAHMQSRPPYMSHAFRVGSSHQFHPKNTTHSHAFNPENAFSSTESLFHPPGGGSFPSIFHENVNTSAQPNSAYAFQSRGECPPFPALGEASYSQTIEGCMPSYLHHFIPSVNQNFDLQRHPSVGPFPSLSYSVQMNEQKTLNSGRQPSHDRKTIVDQSNLEIKESLKVNGLEVDAHHAQHGTLSHQQFYGNGAELLQLLHGNSDKTSGSASDGGNAARLLGDNQNAGTYSKGSALTVHGPIGPPRNINSVTKSPGDILGRFWAVTPSSQKSQDFHPEADLRPSLGTHKTNSSEIPFNEAIWKGKGDVIQEKQVEILLSSVESGKALPSQSNADARSDTAATLKSFASKVSPESIQPHGAGNLMLSWGSWNGVSGPSQTLERSNPCYLHQNYYTSSASHELFKGDQDCNNLKLNSSQGLRTMEPLESSHKEAKIDLLRENQIEARKGAGQRTLSRGEIKRGGSNGIAGQGVAASERQKGRTSEADTYVHGLQAEEEHEFQTSKPTKVVVSKADEAKRRKRKQQEWRLKQPHLGDCLQQIFVKECMEDAGATSVEGEVFVNSENEKHLALVPLASQVEHPGLPAGCLRDSVSGPALQEGRQKLEGVMTAFKQDEMESSGLEMEGHEMHEDILAKEEQEELFEKFADYLELEDDQEVQDHSRHNNRITSQQTMKNPEVSMSRNISREPYLPKQRTLMAPAKKGLRRRADLENFTMQLLVIFRSLIPSEEEETRRRQFLSQLDDVVYNKWPGAKLFLFGSCANAFGVRNSDIDVCLNVDDKQMSTAELVVRMAEILEAANMQNVQALTHARVPIVKFTDPVTDISCDICVNNMLAVVNSKLLHDYAKIDVRLRQLAFIVKYWAKRRQVNETYRGTLSSYAYVLMCIHFLQLRNPPILPCLQGMEHTYCVKVGKIECAYYDKVETLTQFGVQNKDSLGELVTSFFEYWAFHHGYKHMVISVRTGSFLSKDEKAWTRRIGNERHLICIEDPFEVTHDLGRVVNKRSIRVLRNEFYRAAKIMRHDSNPSLTLFEPYIRKTF